MPDAGTFNEDRLHRAYKIVEPVSSSACSSVAQARGASLHQLARQLGHSARRCVRARRKGEDVSGDDIAVVEHSQTVECHFLSFGRKPGYEVGANGGVRAGSLDPFNAAYGVGTAVAPLHALQDHVVASLERQMEVRHQAQLASNQLEQSVVDLDAVER